LSIDELLKIYTGVYTTWNQLPGNSGGSSATIIPAIPPSSSAIYKALLADLKTANGNVTPTLANSVVTVEQNDPGAITSSSSPANTLVPFSSARLGLWNSGYFHNPATVFPGGSSISAGIKLLSGTAPDAATAWSSPVNDYVIYRNKDASSTTPFQPGGTLNWVKTLFANSNVDDPTPYFASAAGQALIAAAGVTPNYADLGNVHA
jgi:hypothetical protein